MRVFCFAAAAALASAVLAERNITVSNKIYSKLKDDIKADAQTSSEQPSKHIPVPWHTLAQAAGLAQEPYCVWQDIGTKVGDSVLLWKSEDATSKSRVSVFKSDSLGIVLSIQGTDAFSLNGYTHDADFFPTDPDSTFDGILPDGIKLDHGFQKGYLDIEKMSIKAVKEQMKKHNETKLTITGHSLGAAIGLLFGLKLDHELEHGVTNVYVFGPPRLGNPKFADVVDEKLGGRYYYAVNGDDIVARVPPRFFGYQHPSGQIWINPANSDHWKYCPGQENKHCSLSKIPDPVVLLNHVGTYFHTLVGWGPLPCPPKVGDVSNVP